MTTIIIMLLYETSVLMYEMEIAVTTYSKLKAQPLTILFVWNEWLGVQNVYSTDSISFFIFTNSL